MKAQTSKKAVCLLLVLCLALSTMTGCGGSGIGGLGKGSSNRGDTDPAATPADTTPDIQSGADVTNTTTGGVPAVSQSSDGAPSDVPADSNVVSTLPAPTEGDNPSTTVPDLPQQTGDPWALTPAPTAEELLRSAFPEGKTMHATMAMTMSGEIAIDFSSMAGDGWEVEGSEGGTVNPEDTRFSLNMMVQLSQDSDTLYMEGTAQSFGFDEASNETVKGYVTRNADGTEDSYTYDSDTQSWTVSHGTAEGSFGVSDLMTLGTADSIDASMFEMEVTETEYILTAVTDNDVMSGLMGGSGTTPTEGMTDLSELGIEMPKTTVTIHFDRSTREIRNFLVTMEPTFLLFFNITNMTLAIANISFDDADVSVPNDVKLRAVEESTFSGSGFSE